MRLDERVGDRPPELDVVPHGEPGNIVECDDGRDVLGVPCERDLVPTHGRSGEGDV